MESGTQVDGRRHDRQRTFTIAVLIDGDDYEIADISVSGFCLANGPKWMAEGQGVSFYFAVDVDGDMSYIAAEGKVVRNKSGDLAINYEPPHEKWDQILPAHLARHG